MTAPYSLQVETDMYYRVMAIDSRELYIILKERILEPDTNISHKTMPSFEDHCKFVKSNPYKYWYLIEDKGSGDLIGSVYISKNNEIGLYIRKPYRGHGHGKRALEAIMPFADGETVYANINPLNEKSKKFFLANGFKLSHIEENIQEVYMCDKYVKNSSGSDIRQNDEKAHSA